MTNGSDPRPTDHRPNDQRPTDPQSLDDVLASIRRIVRSDEESPTGFARRPGPSDGSPDGSAEMNHAADDGATLMLTPDMRADVAPGAAMAGSAGAVDREAVRLMVREVLVEELTGGDSVGLVREIIRDELMNGEIGTLVSQNVLDLVRAEIVRAFEAR